MPTGIESVTIDSIVDKRMTLSNSSWAGELDVGTSWTRLRIGCRMALSDSGANITGTPRFYLGLLANPGDSMADGPLSLTSTTHFVGFMSAKATWERTIGATSHYRSDTPSAVGKKIGATRTVASPFLDTIYHSLKPATNRNAWLIEIEKLSSISTRIRLVTTVGSNADTGDVSEVELREAMEFDTMAGADSYLATRVGVDYDSGGNSATIATDEATDGEWNALCVAWDQSTPVMHISDMLYSVLE